MERSEILKLHGESRRMYLEKLRKMIIYGGRLDLLCGKILGHQITDFHFDIAQHATVNRNSLVIAPRGSGKSTIRTCGHGIRLALVDPNHRICISSRTKPQAIKRLREIKAHFESNTLLAETFGDQCNAGGIWSATELEVKPRTSMDATPTYMVVGAKGSIAGAHFDQSLGDDLVDKTNSSSEVVRNEFLEWYNGTYSPMFDPPTPDVPMRGWKTNSGTRYHNLDAYNTWIKLAEEQKRRNRPYMDTMIVPALTQDSRSGLWTSYWPERWGVEELLDRKAEIGLLQFNAQYQGQTDSMNGELFQFTDFVEIHENDMPPKDELSFFMGVDLAISEETRADYFAIVIIAVDGMQGPPEERNYYMIDFFKEKISSMSAQVNIISKLARQYKVQRIAIDSQGYQKSVANECKKRLPGIQIRPITASKSGEDKYSRGVAIQPLVEAGRVILPCAPDPIGIHEDGSLALKEPRCWPVRENLVLFPNDDHDDLYDAFIYAVEASKGKGAIQQTQRNLDI